MNHVNRMWTKVAQGRADGRLKSTALRSASVAAAAVAGLGIGRALGAAGAEDRRKQAEDSFRRAMYLSCWGPG